MQDNCVASIWDLKYKIKIELGLIYLFMYNIYSCDMTSEITEKKKNIA